MIEKSTVINRCVIGSCRLNVSVTPLAMAALSFSTQDKAIGFRLHGIKCAPLGLVRCEGAVHSLTIQSRCFVDSALFSHQKVSGPLLLSGDLFNPRIPGSVERNEKCRSTL